MFGLFRKKQQAQRSGAEGPLETYDRLIADLERQAAQVRRSAATLLALRGELSRQRDAAEAQLRALEESLAHARSWAKGSVEAVLSGDVVEAGRRVGSSEALAGRAAMDARVLTEVAKELSDELQRLKEEREQARLRLTAGAAISAALRERQARFDALVQLDAARDEVELAHQLAQVYLADRERG